MTTDDATDLRTFDLDADWLDGNSQPYPVHALMGMVLRDLKAIGRNQHNNEQNFDFRGIDDTKDALNPLLSQYGVFYLPDVIERVANHRTTRSGGTMYEVNLHVRYTFFGPAGDSVTGSAWGEGTDMGDKATNKAMTGAEKQMLFQAFAIATKDQQDDDQDRVTGNKESNDTVPSLQCARCKDEGATTVPRFPDHRNGGDPEPYRTHLVDVHGYVRLEDGRVSAPSADAPIDPAPPAADPPAPAPETAPAPDDTSTDDASATDEQPAPDPATTDGMWGWQIAGYSTVGEADDAVGGMKVSELATAIKNLSDQMDLGLAVSGNKGDLQDRLRKAYLTDYSAQPAAADAPPPNQDADASDSAEDFNLERDGFYCPYVAEDGTECDVFPFRTEDEYLQHWNDTHEPKDDAPADDAPADGQAVTPAMLQEMRDAVAGLRGANARAYGKYRKEKGLPAVDEMTWQQIIDAMDFIGDL